MKLPPSFKHRRFLIYWFGITAAWAARQMAQWAILWHINSLTNSPLALGAVGLIQVLPTLLVSLFAGILADSFNRRHVLFITQSLMGVMTVVLGLLTIGNQIQLWMIYLFIGLRAVALTFDLPARQSLVPNLVSGKNLSNAFSTQTIAFQTGAFIGPVLSGLALKNIGQGWTYLTSAGGFLVMIFALKLIGHVDQEIEQRKGKGIDFAAIREGVQYTLKHPLILPSMLLDFLATLFTRADTLMPIIATEILGVGEILYGWLSSAQAIGATLAGLVLSQQARIRKQGRLLLVSVVLIGVGSIGFGLSRTFVVTMLALMLMGASDAVSAVIRNTIRQFQTPDRIRGRMVSVNQIFFMGGPQLGELKSGILGQLVGVPLAITLGGFACILSAGWVARRWPLLNNYDGGDDAPKIQAKPSVQPES